MPRTTIAIRWRFPATREGATWIISATSCCRRAGRRYRRPRHDRRAAALHRSADPQGRGLREGARRPRTTTATPATAQAGRAMSMADDGWAPADGFERTAFYRARQYRHRHRLRAAAGRGSASCSAASGIGARACSGAWPALPCSRSRPASAFRRELPAMPAAELGAAPALVDRRLRSATALGARPARVYGRSRVAALAAIALLVAPHLIGAPQPVSYETPIPEGLHHSFVVAVALDHAAVLGAARRLGRAVPGTFRPRQADLANRDAAAPGLLTLVLGGARSGKSRYAEWLIATYPPPWIYIATAEARDDEMAERIAAHQGKARCRLADDRSAARSCRRARGRACRRGGAGRLPDAWLSNHAGRSVRHRRADGETAGGAGRAEPGRPCWSPTRSASASCPTTRWRGGSATCKARSTKGWRRRRRRVVLMVAGLPVAVKSP